MYNCIKVCDLISSTVKVKIMFQTFPKCCRACWYLFGSDRVEGQLKSY